MVRIIGCAFPITDLSTERLYFLSLALFKSLTMKIEAFTTNPPSITKAANPPGSNLKSNKEKIRNKPMKEIGMVIMI